MLTRLLPSPPPGWQGPPAAESRGGPRFLQPAAVLIGLAAYGEEIKVILTQRTAALRDHSGQIAFPGGKIEPCDTSPAAAAMREAKEEIGLDMRHIEPLGYLDSVPTGTGFCIFPFVAKVSTPFDLRINPDEVEDAFEVPFAFLMDPANHALLHKEFDGKPRKFHAMPYGERYIWGVTAGILRNLYERLYC
ncbi:MAG: CoA pyrophosphatase [Beijerinckiaceae bacterium]|nr:CoA pyrophosphatase [Beijerinckiaceae bacterium]